MERDIINLISSSPPTVRPSRLAPLETRVEILPDECDPHNPPVLASSNGNKRRRISRSPSRQVSSKGLSSRAHAAEHIAYLHDSDPFASSPPRPAAPQDLNPVSTTTPDPFASSPQAATKSPHRHAGTRLGGQLETQRHRPLEAISSPVASEGQSNKPCLHWDPISSSAPEAASFGERGKGAAPGSCFSLAIDIESESGSEDLPDVTSLAHKPLLPKPGTSLRRSQSDAPISRETGTKKPNRNASAREADKEQKRRERQALKEAKAQERERAAALSEVNKIRDKKASAQEMIVDLPSGLSSTIRTQTETLLEGLCVRYTAWESSQSIIQWRRTVTSTFDESLGLWQPAPPRVKSEDQLAVLLTADEFVALVLEDGVDYHVAQVKASFPRCNVIYILEGLRGWVRKNRNIRNRQFSSGVRSQETSAASEGARRRNAPSRPYVSEDRVEDALVELQIKHNLLVHETATPLETAQWLVVLTQHISTIPYRHRKEQATAGFCMESGQVRTGDDAKDTYVRILQEIARVTPPIAHGIGARFGSVTKLVYGLEKDGPLTLGAIPKTVNKEGTLSERTVGQAVSRRIHKVFTGGDERSTDI